MIRSLFLLSMLLPAILNAATIVVTTTDDNGAGSIRNALSNAGSGDLIDASGITGTITLTNGELVVATSVDIRGPGPALLSIDGNGQFRGFNVGTDITVSIAGLTITNGVGAATGLFGDTIGGGIYSAGSTLTVSNCTVSGNTAFAGGGIFNDGVSGSPATLTIVDSSVGGNTVEFDGGGIYSWSFDGSATLVARNVTFAGNGADHGAGIEGAGGVSVDGCTFTGNTAATGGGGIDVFVEEDIVSLEVVNSTFTGNTAGFSGGAVNVEAIDALADLLLGNSGLTSNSAGFGGGVALSESEDAAINNSTFAGNSSSDSGGAIYNFRSLLAVSNSTLNANTAVSRGGGILNDGETSDADLLIVNSTLSGNSAGIGGGLYNRSADSAAGFAEVLHSTFSSNNIANEGTAVLVDTLALGHTILDGSSLTNLAGTIASLGYNLSSDDGGGFLNQTGDLINSDPLLGSLADNGGPTLTHALSPASPARNAGDPSFTPPPAFDQRGPGFRRVRGSRIDIGAFEFEENTPPVALCSNVTVLAGASCASVEVSVDNGSFDPDDDAITVTQSPPGPYGLGTTLVTLTVIDTHEGTNSCTATVTVVSVPASIACPGNQTALATSTGGAFVNYPDPTVAGICDPVITAVPPSGSLFPIGNTTVQISTTDSLGHPLTCTFTVHVKGALEQLVESLDEIDDANIDPRVAHRISNQLERIGLKLAHLKSPCKQIASFLKKIERYHQQGKLDAGQADALTQDTLNISRASGCSSKT